MDQKAELVKLLDQKQEYGIDANRPDLDMPCIDNDEVADHLIANGVVVPVLCSECINNECCSIQKAMGESGYCSKGKRREVQV